jgi:hypothetical protein
MHVRPPVDDGILSEPIGIEVGVGDADFVSKI